MTRSAQGAPAGPGGETPATDPLFDERYTAVSSRDRRFDGRFFTGVLTTGIFCRPSCPARTPKPENVRFFPSPAAATQAGLRACRRCRPELAPDAPDADPAAALANRAMALIDAGRGDEGVTALAAAVHVSPRHLRRTLTDTYGAGPAALSRMRRVRLARLLVDQTDLSMTRVAYAAGFGSVRQFNEAFAQTFGMPPGAVRRGSAQRPSDGAAGASTTLRLATRQPFDGHGILRWAALHAIPSRDDVDVAGGRWTRVVDGDEGPVAVVLRPEADGLAIGVDLAGAGDLRPIVATARRVFDLDADVGAMTAHLDGDPLLGPILARRPGVRIAAAADPYEGAIRVIVGQQVSAKGATTLMGRIADLADRPGLPDPDQLALADLEALVGLTRQRATAVRAMAAAIADGLDVELTAQTDPAALTELPGIGPWSASCIALLVGRDPDAWPTGDLALRRVVGAARAASGGTSVAAEMPTSAELDDLARSWRPWRGYAAMALWHASLD